MTNQPGMDSPTPSDAVAERIRQMRQHRKLTAAELAEQCAKAGHPELTRDAIYAIESGRRVKGRRRRHVTVDEALAFSKVFDVPAEVLLWPILDTEDTRLPALPFDSMLLFDSPQQLARYRQAVNKMMALAKEMSMGLEKLRAVAEAERQAKRQAER
jgi:transcriptional regulator with XRE-family HTH domain